ncbi:MAG: class I SAM-dependent methyltransferase [Deltaproteobacteria bacterium]|nr:class I SAM-dependent methyltransferase [Deltaproteobacteria bacterium]
MRGTKSYKPEVAEPELCSSWHRDAVGGMWDEIGRLQFDFLRARGLSSKMVFLDVGCGCFRGGIHFIRFLDAGHYYGLDMNQTLIDEGFEKELKPAGLAEKMPRENCACNEAFDFSAFAGIKFDMALAQSVFTHLNFNQIRLCLERLVHKMKEGASFYASFFECPPNRTTGESIYHECGGVTSYGATDPYHYRIEDLSDAAKHLPWLVSNIGDWGHPRDQKIICFNRK